MNLYYVVLYKAFSVLVYFGYKANSKQDADFEETGIELKATCYEVCKRGKSIWTESSLVFVGSRRERGMGSDCEWAAVSLGCEEYVLKLAVKLVQLCKHTEDH